MRYHEQNIDRKKGVRRNSSIGRSLKRSFGRRAVRRFSFFSLLTVCTLIFGILTFGVLHSSAGSEQEHHFKYYTSIVIEEGDTLWSIADQYMDRNVQGKIAYIDEVKSINHIHDGDRITVGQMLIVPYYSTEYIPD